MPELYSTVPEQACCLAWAITKATRDAISGKQLRALQCEVISCAELIGAEVIEFGATHGVLRAIRSFGSTTASTAELSVRMTMLSKADKMVRLGQLICRWAAEEDPEVSVRIGVHIGELHWLALPNQQQKGFFGSALSMSKHLAEISPKENVVHLLPSTKQMLCVLERMAFSVHRVATGSSSYYLEHWEEARDDDAAEEMRGRSVVAQPSTYVASSLTGGVAATVRGMSEADFAHFLSDYGVDTTRFGRGQAKTLSAFLKSIVEEKSCHLFAKDNTLERKVEIVRISLVCQNGTGTDHFLNLAYEVMRDGRTRPRNQKLAVVVPEGSSWQDAVKLKFVKEFKLDEELQREALSVEANFYKEVSKTSPSIPGIVTTYMTHEVRMRVLDPNRAGLDVIGLPKMTSFQTQDTASSSVVSEAWSWSSIGESLMNKAESLHKLLTDHLIDVSEFESGAFNNLIDEVYETRISTLTVRRKELIRNLQIIKVWIAADILSVPHTLICKHRIQKGKKDTKCQDRPISMRLKHEQTWKDALAHTLNARLGLDGLMQQEVEVDEGSYRLLEEVEYSRSYPGLKTVYRIHEVTCRMPSNSTILGLPNGNDFVCVRQEDKGELSMHYAWKSKKDIFGRRKSFRKRMLDDGVDDEVDLIDTKRRLPAPEPLSAATDGVSKTSSLAGLMSSAQSLIEEMMQGKKTNWDRARNAAKRIRDPDYSCKHFWEDCVASFPELALYLGVNKPGKPAAAATTSSGRSTDDEYQRTLGALFAVYWLMRLNTDGAQSFSFGVGENWEPLHVSSRSPRRSEEELNKRALFLERVDWKLFNEVLISAGIFRKAPPGSDSEYVHDEERTLAMLVLTAIHDIMKVQALCPVVSMRQREFCGYKAGEVITDHDIALGYVLEFMPDALPSFAGLPPAQRESVKFTQCNMEYNMGWLVQAEAPPGALFQKFRQIIRAGKADPRDVAFYFTHWLTDLAGAEPYPQEGAEKFVLKFPQKVLTSFLQSFKFVQHLSDKTETQVFEDYLEWRWTTHEPSLGPAPMQVGSIAKLRLVVMAQGSSQLWLDAYSGLPAGSRAVLDAELACTGCAGQYYSRDPGGSRTGPAFLVYYAPALLQKNPAEARGALSVLAEVLRQARSLWPLDDRQAGESVTVLIDSLKELSVQAMQTLNPGDIWALQRVTAKSAQVRKLSMLKDGNQEHIDWASLRVLTLGLGSQPSQPTENSLFQEQEDVLVGGIAPPEPREAAEVHEQDAPAASICGISGVSWINCWSKSNRQTHIGNAEVVVAQRLFLE